MASVQLGPIVSDARGSIAAVTFGRNIGGIFARERVSPSQPASSERDLRQAAMTALSQAWSTPLTQAMRDKWNTYGRQHLLPDRWGRPGTRPGFLHFIRTNFQRYRIAPAIYWYSPPPGPPIYPPTFTFTADASLNTIVVDVPPTNYPDPPQYFRIYAYAGHVLNVGRVFYNGPWRYIGWNMKMDGTWLYDPWSMSYPWTLTATKRVYVRLVAQMHTGELSIAHQLADIIVA